MNDYIGDENSLDDEIPVGNGIFFDETSVDNPISIGDENPLVDVIPIGDEISVDDNPIDGEPSASDEVPAGNEISPEIQNESQLETESTPEGEADEIPEYLAEPDAISEGDILQQADSSATNPEMISEQDGLVEEGSPEKQTTASNEPEANVSSVAQTTGAYSQAGAQGNTIDAEDDSVMLQSQIDEPPQRQPFKTDYSEDDLGKAAVEINNENTDINKFVQDLKQQDLTPEQYLEQKRTEYASLDAGNSSPLDEHSVPGEQSENPKTARLFYEGTDPDLVGSSNQENEREYRIGSPHDDWEDYKKILDGEKQHNIGLAAQTSDKLGEALGTLAEASQGNTDFTDADNYIYGKYGRAPYTDTYPQVAPADVTLDNDALQNQNSGGKTIPATDSSARNDSMTDIPVSPPLPDVVYIAQKDSGDATLQSMPLDINVIKDAQERDITIRRWGDDGLIQLRAYDSAKGDVPEIPNLGTAGMTNLKIEEEADGQTKVRLQDIVIPPDYRKSGIAGNMLDETVDIAQAKGASEIYGVIENEEALSYWKHMEKKGTGWKVEPSKEAEYGYVRYDLNKRQQRQDLTSATSPTASLSKKQISDIPISPSIPGMENNATDQLIVDEIQRARANAEAELESEIQEDVIKLDDNIKSDVPPTLEEQAVLEKYNRIRREGHAVPDTTLSILDRAIAEHRVETFADVQNKRTPLSEMTDNELKGLVQEANTSVHLQEKYPDSAIFYTKKDDEVVQLSADHPDEVQHAIEYQAKIQTDPAKEYLDEPDFLVSKKNQDKSSESVKNQIVEVNESKGYTRKNTKNPNAVASSLTHMDQLNEATKYTGISGENNVDVVFSMPEETAGMQAVQDALSAKSKPNRPIHVEAVSSEAEINQMMDDMRHSLTNGQQPSEEQLNQLKEIRKLPDDERQRAFSKFLDGVPSTPSEQSRIPEEVFQEIERINTLPVKERLSAWGSYLEKFQDKKGNPDVVARNIREAASVGGDAIIVSSPSGKKHVIQLK